METVVRERMDLMRSQRAQLAQELKQARKAGATIQQLIEWTGYSRRTIYYMLEETKP